MHEPDIAVSSLSRSIEQSGERIVVRIYRLNDSDWILEIVSRDGCSTLWAEPFESDEAALAEALNAIKDEGIKSFSANGGAPASAVH